MKQNFLNGGAVAFLVALLSSPALSQMPGPQGGPRPVPPVMEELDRMTEKERGPAGGEEGARHFEAKKRERLMQFLHLDEATRAKFSQRLGQLDQKSEDLRRQRREAFQALQEHAKGLRKGMRRGQQREGNRRGPDEPPTGGPPEDESALRQALERVYAVEDAMAGLRHERLQVVRDLLTPEQQVKFLIFTMKFQKEMRERLQQEHGGRDGGVQERRQRFEEGGEREKP